MLFRSLFHRTGPFRAVGCLAAAEPGLLLHIRTPEETTGPLPVCRPCYAALAPLADGNDW